MRIFLSQFYKLRKQGILKVFKCTRFNTNTSKLISGKNYETGISRGGRNNQGRITVRSRGGFRWRQKIRFVDFWRKVNDWGFLIKFIRDPVRTAVLGLVAYKNGLLSFFITPLGINVGDCFFTGDNTWLNKDLYMQHSFTLKYNRSGANLGDSILLKNMNLGAFIYNVEMYPGRGGQLVRSAGTFGILMSKDEKLNTVVIKLNTGWKMLLSGNCMASIGIVNNEEHKTFQLEKAGKVRNYGRRPKVRGVAMNAVDHPHGGGRGKTSGGHRALSPWGKITKHRKTISKKKRLLVNFKRFR